MLRVPKGARSNLAPFFIGAFLFLFANAQAEVPVVDLGGRSVSITPARVESVQQAGASTSVQGSAGAQEPLGILYTQIQTLQEEVQLLRGQLEQQQNELQKLKQQQKDNYLDVDKRLSALQASPSVSATIPPVAPEMPSVVMNQAGEKASYDAAYELLNQNKKEEAILAFRKHLINYPAGEYAGNSMYWLGVTFLSQAKFFDAEAQFSDLLKKMPDHRKAVDAKFSLGKVYFQQGKKMEAKTLITEVSQTNSPTAKLALDFLNSNF